MNTNKEDWLPEDELEYDFEEDCRRLFSEMQTFIDDCAKVQNHEGWQGAYFRRAKELQERCTDLNAINEAHNSLAKISDAIVRMHFTALNLFIETGGRDLCAFAQQFPRTWNALVTNNPHSFDLPHRR